MLLHCYEEQGEAFLSGIVTRVETWIFHYTAESKAESVTWKPTHSSQKEVQDSAVSKGQGSIPSGERRFFSFYHNVQTTSGVNPAPCMLGPEDCFPGGKAAGASS
jgi:hypothetical protein